MHIEELQADISLDSSPLVTSRKKSSSTYLESSMHQANLDTTSILEDILLKPD